MKPELYKVTYNGWLYSESAGATNEARVIYKQGAWAFPPDWLWEKGYGLLCFDSLEHAKMTYREMFPYTEPPSCYSIWRVDYDRIIPIKPRCIDGLLCQYKTFRRCRVGWPTGTVMVHSLMLIEEVC